MNKIKKWSAGICMLLALLVTFNACKKDDKEKGAGANIEAKVTGYYPNSGKAGTLVTVEGEGFGTSLNDYSATVSGNNADVISVTANAVVVRIPDGTTGKIVLKAGSKTFEVGSYTYQDLSVKDIFPANGPAGAQIRISGEGFASVSNPASVLINNVSALVVSVADTLIVAEVPQNAGFGPVTVKVDGKEAQGRNFTYQEISNMKPLSGGANTRVVLNGVGFETALANNKVDFNGKAATVVEGNDKQLVVLAPADVTTGPLSVTINGQKITGQRFTVVGKPVIGIVSPLSGPKGTEMTIQGDVFSAVADENKVFINNVEVPLNSVTATQITLTIPGGTGSGNIRVVVNDQATTGPAFKDQTLGIKSLTPDNGLAGTSVTITGTGFSTTASDNKVYFNDVLTTVKSSTETQLVVDAPANLSTGIVKVATNGLETTSPQPFKRAGIITIAGGPSNPIGSIQGIAVDSHDNVYVTNTTDGTVNKITPAGVVSKLQANGADVHFSFPNGIYIDGQDNIYVADQNASQIRKITPSGQNVAFTGGFQPAKMSMDASGNMYVGIAGFGAGMNKVTPLGNYTKVAGPSWPSSRPAIDAAGNVFYSDNILDGGTGIQKISVGGGMAIIAGAHSEGGLADGIGRSARFNGITGLVFTSDNQLVVADRNNRAIRLVNPQNGATTTLFATGYGFADGTFANAKFASIDDIAVGKDGSIYVIDGSNGAVRKIILK
ncbi:IPT/TIG domain-containing protein [Mucilaginibacter sp. JRF]|uniref:IPT/TIG domain-containing protein n=1 Tax=Mucilaginibacter sp. JRF TaxID=2780088 RepID=UPI001882F7AF|nr:IPT/TIG domain-containing protein [Mucilaginibacter sp. JRF]MBE9586220.1 IPT/TIG domain-containing protein [Mucilaginibacter sp. JRF]